MLSGLLTYSVEYKYLDRRICGEQIKIVEYDFPPTPTPVIEAVLALVFLQVAPKAVLHKPCELSGELLFSSKNPEAPRPLHQSSLQSQLM